MSDKNLSDILAGVEEISVRAGLAINEVYADAEGVEIDRKADNSPLTQADLASHEVIKAGLAELAPEIPVLSEEGKELAYAERRGWKRFFLVDPLDGTKEFIKRNGEFTVNVALIEDGVPILGVVHSSILKRTYSAIQGEGAWRQDEDGEKRPIRASGTGDDELVVVASRSHAGEELTAFLDQLPPHRLSSMGSSLKLCLVAEGAADIYPRIGPTMEWDTGAAHAVVLGAGGQVWNVDGTPLVYNKENLLNPYFVVTGEREIDWQGALAASRAS